MIFEGLNVNTSDRESAQTPVLFNLSQKTTSTFSPPQKHALTMPRPALALLLLGVLGPLFASEPAAPWRELLLTRTELADSDNVLVRWRPLFPSLQPADPAVAAAISELGSPLSPAPSDPRVLAWLAGLEPVFAQTSLAKNTRLQLPRIHGPETPFPDHQPLRQLAVARVIAMKAAWVGGKPDNALSLALENLNLSRELFLTQEGLIPLLITSGIWQISLDGVYWLARQPDLTAAQAATLQTALLRDHLLASDALARAFRGEFTFFTRLVIERLPKTRDPEILLGGISSLGMSPAEPPPDTERHLAVATRELLDADATLQAAAEDVRGWVNAFESTSRHPRGLHERHTARRLHGYAREIPALFHYATQDAQPAPGQIAAANAELATVENPVGKLFLIITTSQWEPLSVAVFRREAQRSALTGLLAWRRHGKPAPWKDLVEAGLLSAPPPDPFSSEPLRCKLTPATIWSVGADGTDDGGSGDGENLGQPPDLTWPAAIQATL
jgi:hypothetical protein